MSLLVSTRYTAWPIEHSRRVNIIELVTEGLIVKGLNERIYSRFIALKNLKTADINAMYRIYSRFYQNTTHATFLDDLQNKTGAIVARTRSTKRIIGFSTLTVFDCDIDGKKIRGIFSGDTIVEPEFWGSRCLHVAFYRQILLARLRHPFTPLYWFLISKGYKTYLLLTRNFYDYYPDRNQPDSKLGDIVRAFSKQQYPNAFDPERMLLDFGEGAACLDENVAQITPEIRAQEPDIAYFEDCNPSWRQGTELPCAGEISFSALTKYCYHLSLKVIRLKLKQRAIAKSQSAPDVLKGDAAGPEI